MLGQADKWGGADDVSYQFGVVHDDAYVYVAVKTKDDDVLFSPDKGMYEQDSAQLWFDARSESDKTYGLHACAIDLFTGFLPLVATAEASADKKSAYVPERLPDGVKIACDRTSDGYTTEFAIPVEYLDKMQKKAWHSFTLNVIVTDVDKDGSVQILTWRPHWFSNESFPGAGTFVRK